MTWLPLGADAESRRMRSAWDLSVTIWKRPHFSSWARVSLPTAGTPVWSSKNTVFAAWILGEILGGGWICATIGTAEAEEITRKKNATEGRMWAPDDVESGYACLNRKEERILTQSAMALRGICRG